MCDLPSPTAVHEAAHAVAAARFGWFIHSVQLDHPTGAVAFLRGRAPGDPEPDSLDFVREKLVVSLIGELTEHAFSPEPLLGEFDLLRVRSFVPLPGSDMERARDVAVAATDSDEATDLLLGDAQARAMELVANEAFRRQVISLANWLDRERTLDGTAVHHHLETITTKETST